MALAARYVFFVPLFPVAFPLVKLWGLVSRHGDDDGRLWYAVLIFVQVVGGLMTEVSSIYFAVSTNNALSILSALFGMYSLIVSTLILRLKGPKTLDEEETFAQRSQKLAANVRHEILKYGLIGVAVVVGLGVLTVPFLGVYFIQSCDNNEQPFDDVCIGSVGEGKVLAAVGFVVLSFLWLFLLVSAYNGVGTRVVKSIEPGRAVAIVFFSGLGIILTGLGIVYAIYNKKVDALFGDDKISDYQSRIPPETVVSLLCFGCLFLVVVAALSLPLYCRPVHEDGPVADPSRHLSSKSVSLGSVRG